MYYGIDTKLEICLEGKEEEALETVETLLQEILDEFPNLERVSAREKEYQHFWLTRNDFEEMKANLQWFRLYKGNLRLEEY